VTLDLLAAHGTGAKDFTPFLLLAQRQIVEGVAGSGLK